MIATARSSPIPALTGLRAVAAGMVFFYHWLFDMPNAWPLVPRAFFSQGYLGVAIFFALSGFLITVRYRDDLRERRVSYGAYLLKRFVRIYPVYFFVLTFFVVALGRPVGFAPTTMVQGIITYTLTQALFPPLRLSGVSTAWTLTIEEMFYFSAPWLMTCLGGAKRMVYARALLASALLAAACLAIAVLISALPQVWPGFIAGASLEYIITNSILGRLPDFLAGMLAGLLYLRRDRAPWLLRNARRMALACALLLALAIIAVQATDAPGDWVINRALGVLVAACAAGLILALACDDSRSSVISRVLGSRPIEYAGKISYVLYLVQLTEPVQYIYWVVIGDALPRLPRALALYLAASAISALLYHLVEQPAQRGLSRILRLR